MEQTKAGINNSVRRLIKIKYHNRDGTSFFWGCLEQTDSAEDYSEYTSLQEVRLRQGP